MPGKRRDPSRRSALRAGIVVPLFFDILIPESLGNALRHALQLDLADAVSCPLQQPHFLLAEGEHEKMAVATQQWQEGLDVEAVRDHDYFV
jgi:hypothetical protein